VVSTRFPSSDAGRDPAAPADVRSSRHITRCWREEMVSRSWQRADGESQMTGAAPLPGESGEAYTAHGSHLESNTKPDNP